MRPGFARLEPGSRGRQRWHPRLLRGTAGLSAAFLLAGGLLACSSIDDSERRGGSASPSPVSISLNVHARIELPDDDHPAARALLEEVRTWWREQAGLDLALRVESADVGSPGFVSTSGAGPCTGSWRQNFESPRTATASVLISGPIRVGLSEWRLGYSCLPAGPVELCGAGLGGDVLVHFRPPGVLSGAPDTAAVLAHELGHVLGLGHADRPCNHGVASASTGDNLMGPEVHSGDRPADLGSLTLSRGQRAWLDLTFGKG